MFNVVENETKQSKIVNLSMNDFLTEDFNFNPTLEKVVSETIHREGLIIYAGIVSDEERGDTALATGGNTFNNLKDLEQLKCLNH